MCRLLPQVFKPALTNQAVTFDPLSASFARDPYPVYAQMRQSGQAYYFEPQDMWLLSRYDDVAGIATNPAMVRSLVGIESEEDARARLRRANWHDMPFHERVIQFSLLDSDGEIHRRLRRQVFGEFTSNALAGLEFAIQRIVDDLLNGLEDRNQIDFIADFANHVPGFVIGMLLGVPEKDCPQLRIWSEQVVQFFDVDRSDERKQIAETATQEFYQYLSELKVERKAALQDDLISKMIVDEQNGLYSADEFISTCMLILMAGHGSTIDVLGTGLYTLLKNPDVMMRLRNEPALLPSSIQEMFRYESPLPFFHRHALEPVCVGNERFEAGTTFGLLYGAANRDEEQFYRADRFVPDRAPNRHLAFGLGAHLCLGNNLARLNMKVIFKTLLRRFSSIETTSETVCYKRGLSVRGLEALPICWERVC